MTGYQNVTLIRKFWRRAIGKFDGNVDIQFFRQNLAKMASHLSKYITKGIEEEHTEGQHRYKRSRGIVFPSKLTLIPQSSALDVKILAIFSELAET